MWRPVAVSPSPAVWSPRIYSVSHGGCGQKAGAVGTQTEVSVCGAAPEKAC